jgi:hypothetical protein
MEEVHVAIEGAFGVIGVIVSIFLSSLLNEIRGVRKSIERLNTGIAVVIERIDHHEVRIGKLEDRKK